MPRIASARFQLRLPVAIALIGAWNASSIEPHTARRPNAAFSSSRLHGACTHPRPLGMEEPEDLHTLAAIVGVAWLAETDILSDHVAVLPRRQPLRAASPMAAKPSWYHGYQAHAT